MSHFSRSQLGPDRRQNESLPIYEATGVGTGVLLYFSNIFLITERYKPWYSFDPTLPQSGNNLRRIAQLLV